MLEPGERKLYTLVQQLNTIRNVKSKKRAEAAALRRKAHDKRRAKLDAEAEARNKVERKKRYREEGKAEARKKSRRGGGDDDD